MKGDAVRLHSLNLSARVRQRFEYLFGVAGRGIGLLVNEAVAEAVLVDMDVDGAEQRLAVYRERFPERPALLLAQTAAAARPGDQLLIKPVAIRALLVALQALRDTVAHTVAESPAEQDGETDAGGATAPARTPERADKAADETEPTTTRRPHHGDEAATAVRSRRPSTAAPGGDETTEAHRIELPTMVMPRRLPDPEATSIFTPEGHAARKSGRAEERTQVLPRQAAARRVSAPATEEDPARWAELCGLREDLDPEDTDAAAALWLAADGLLLPRLAAAARQALDEQRLLELRAGSLRITLDGASDYAYANRDEASVRALCAGGPVEEAVSVTPASRPRAVLLSRSGNPTAHWPTVESAVWQAALWTYVGRLPAGTVVSERVYLQRWPNFTRLAALPHALRIAALWVEQPLSLVATATLLGVPQRYVYAFYGAAHALGLSGPARRGADSLFETPPAMLVPRRPLLGALVQHLRGLTTDAAAPTSRAAV